MVSTRHHPKAFPEPASPTGTSRRTPQTPTSTTTSSRMNQDSPPPPSTRRAASRRRKSTVPKTEEDEIKQIAEEAARAVDKVPVALATRSHTRSPLPSKSKVRSTGPTVSAVGSYEHTPPPFLVLWLVISIPLVIWDAGYVLGRPHTMRGGFIHKYLYKPYDMYGTVDYIYGWPAWDEHNGFTGAQATLNIFETAFYIWYLAVLGKRVVGGDGFFRGVALKSLNIFARYDGQEKAKLIVRGESDLALAVVLCFSSAVMTLSKTILYGFNEHFAGYKHVGHNDWMTLYLFWLPMNGAWIVVPTYMCYILGKEMIEAMTTSKGGR